MKQIDLCLFRWLYGSFPKVGTFYYAVRQPMLILFLMFLGLMLAIPCGIIDGIVEAVVRIADYLSESVRVAAYRFKKYMATTRELWRVATIKIEGGAK